MAASRVGLFDGSGRSSRRPVSRGSSISVVCVARCCSGRSFFLPPPPPTPLEPPSSGSSVSAFVTGVLPSSRAVVLRGNVGLARAVGLSGPPPPAVFPCNSVRVHIRDGSRASGAPESGSRDRKMRLRIRWILLLVSTAVVILAGCDAATEKEQSDSKQRTSASSTYNTFPDDLYLDDQDVLEGSGRGGSDSRDDLEASGSGLGPDDEDGDDDHEFTGNNGLEVPSKPTEARPPYIIDETNVKTKQQTTIDTVNRPGNEANVIDSSGTEDDHADNTDDIHEVYIMNPKSEDRTSPFFAQPGVLAAVIGGAVVGLLCAILVVMFIVYRMRKKDEGSYALDEPRRSPAAAQAFLKPGAPHHNREFYA